MEPTNGHVEVSTVGHTDEVRELVAAGEVRLGDRALDVPVASMTDREILEETLIHARNTRDTVNGLFDSIMSSPLGAMISGGKIPGPLGLLFGQPMG